MSMEDQQYESYDVTVTCSACLCELSTDEQRQQHYTSDWHIYNIKRKTAELPPIPYELFHEKFALVQKMQAEDKLKNGKIVCPVTQREFKSQGAYDHFRSSKEYARQYQRFVNKQQAIQQAKASGIELPTVVHDKYAFVWSKPKPEDDCPNENDLALLEQDRLDAEADMTAAAAEAQPTTTTTTTQSTMNDTPDETEEDELEPLKPGQFAIPLRHSLFDNVGPFSCPRTAYIYMTKKYNFKLPYMSFLIDFEGLLEYLGAKVGIGHMCIGCNKRFPTTQGCMQHMVSQNHTAFTLETLQAGNDTGDDESSGDFLFDFYDFSHNFADSTYTEEQIKQRQMSRLRTLLVLGQKTLAEIHYEESKGNDVLSKVLTVPIERDVQLSGLTEDGNIKLSNGTQIYNRRTKHDAEMAKSMIHYEKKNQQILEFKLANQSVMTKEKAEDLHELKHVQKYWRREHLRCGLRNNYIIKEYFRKQNQQNN